MPPKKKKEVKLTPAEETVKQIAEEIEGLVSIHRAAYLGNLEDVTTCCEGTAGNQLSPLDESGRTPLSLAAEYGQAACAAKLLEADANVMATSYGGRSALHFAAKDGQLEIITLLSEAKADPTHQDDCGQTPLHLAAKAGHLKPTEKICELKGVNVDETNKAKATPLMGAVLTCQLAIVDALIGRGADVNAADGMGNTSLHMAARCGYNRVVDKLLNAEARADFANRAGQLPSDVAVTNDLKSLLSGEAEKKEN